MTYLLKSTRRDNKGRNLLIQGAVILVIILAFSMSGSLRSGSASLLQKIGVPMWSIENYIYNSQGGFFAYMRSKHSLAVLNEKLISENESLKASNLKTSVLQDENETLKNDLGRTTKGVRTLATVLVSPSRSVYDSLIIDIGADHALSVGDFVASNDVYIGKVAEVYAHSSKVVLFSSGDQKFEVLLNPSHVSVTAYGRGGGNFEAQVPRDIDIAEGDVVTVPGIAVDIFATIEAIVEKPTDSFKTILFKSPVNIETLKWVDVVKG
jgi:cell shape-determining protein MreC